MTPCTFIRFDDGTWQLWIRYTGSHLLIWIADYPTRGAALQAAASIDGIG